MGELPSGTVTFLFTDIEGSTLLLRRLRDAYADVLADHARLLRGAFEEHGGHEVDTQGDSFFVAFARARDAAAAAVAAQRALAAADWPQDAEVRVRMGLHSGEPLVGDERYVGLGVHRTARICAAGHGGQILLSNVTRELVEDELPHDVALRDLGEHRLKDLPRPERLFDLVVEGLPSDFPPLKTAEGGPVAGIAGREAELAAAAGATVARRPALGRRGLLAAALMGVLAAAVAIPVFALGRGDSGGGERRESGEHAAVQIEGDDVVTDVPLKGPPRSLAWGDGSIWATSADAGAVYRIDPGSGDVEETIPLGGGPSGIAFDGRTVWVALQRTGEVKQISPDTNEVVRTVRAGNGPVGVAYGGGFVWVVHVDDRLVRIDPISGDPERYALEVAGHAVAVGAGSVWVADEGTNQVIRLDPEARTTELIDVGNGPSGLAVAGGSVWVANSLDGTVSRISSATNTVSGTMRVGDGAASIAADPDGDAVWVASEFSGTATRFDASTGAIERVVRLGDRPKAIVGTSSGVWVAVESAGAVHRGGTLRVSGVPEDIDPAFAHGGSSWSLLSLTGDGLVAFRRAGGIDGSRLVPDLATSLPAPTNGGKTYTFRLRAGLRYSTGTPVRATDFRRALERLFSTRSPDRGYFAKLVGAPACQARPTQCSLVRGVVTSDRSRTVAFRLTEPDADFLYKLATPFTYPAPPGTPKRRLREAVPGTGPYRVQSYTRGRGARLVRNRFFRRWAGAAQPGGFPDVIEWNETGSGARAVRLVQQGQLDVLEGLDTPPQLLETLRTQYAGQLHVEVGRNTWYASLNTRAAPFTSLVVRRALNHAVDRNRVVGIAGGQVAATPTCQVLPPNTPGYRRFCLYEHDLAEARRLVRGSGTRGDRVTVWTTSEIPLGVPLARHIEGVLRSLGYRVSVRIVTDVVSYFRTILQPGNSVQIAISGWQADFASAASFVLPNFACAARGPTPDSPSNSPQLCDSRVEAAIGRALRAQAEEPQAAGDLWAAVDRTVMSVAPWVPLFNGAEIRFVSKRVRNYQFHPQWGVLLDQLWVR